MWCTLQQWWHSTGHWPGNFMDWNLKDLDENVLCAQPCLNLCPLFFFFFFLESSVSWNLPPFKADFISENRQNSFRAKSGKYGGCSITIINFWHRNCWDWVPCELEHFRGGEFSWAKVQAFFYSQLQVTASLFPCKNEFEVNRSFDIQESDEHCFICDFYMRPCLNHLCHSKSLYCFAASPT